MTTVWHKLYTMQVALVFFFFSLLFGQLGGISPAPGVTFYIHDIVLGAVFFALGDICVVLYNPCPAACFSCFCAVRPIWIRNRSFCLRVSPICTVSGVTESIVSRLGSSLL